MKHSLLTMPPNWKSVTLPHGIHAFVGGSGPPLVLLPGWPETAEAFAEILPLLAEHHLVYAIDPPGLGLSDPPPSGLYDTTAISTLLESSIRSTMSQPYHLLGHDVGGWIAYAWASQYPSSILSLSLLDCAIPGLAAPLTFPLPAVANAKLWQFSFNALPDLPELLTRGREHLLFDWLFDRKAVHPERITSEKRVGYVKCYSREGGMSQGFAYYRAAGASAEQNVVFARKGRLGMPVFALGGEGGVGGSLETAMQDLAEGKVQGGVVANCGHYVMEEQPEVVAGMLSNFLKSV